MTDYDALLRDHRGQMLWAAAKRAGNWSDAEDAVQDALLKMWEEKVDSERAAPVAITLAKWNARSTRRRRLRETPAEWVEKVPDKGPVPSLGLPALADPTVRLRVLKLLEYLPPQRRHVVEMRCLEGMSVAQTAAWLGMRPDDVGSVCSRGLADLAQLSAEGAFRKGRRPHRTPPSPAPTKPSHQSAGKSCARCGEVKPLVGRGLDMTCWARARRDGSLARYPRRRTYAQVIEEYDAHVGAGLSPDDIADRMGYASLISMQTVIRRARDHVAESVPVPV